MNLGVWREAFRKTETMQECFCSKSQKTLDHARLTSVELDYSSTRERSCRVARAWRCSRANTFKEFIDNIFDDLLVFV